KKKLWVRSLRRANGCMAIPRLLELPRRYSVFRLSPDVSPGDQSPPEPQQRVRALGFGVRAIEEPRKAPSPGPPRSRRAGRLGIGKARTPPSPRSAGQVARTSMERLGSWFSQSALEMIKVGPPSSSSAVRDPPAQTVTEHRIRAVAVSSRTNL